MSNREEPTTVTVTTYRQDDAGNVYRLRETIRQSYHTGDGGYMPQRVLWSQESLVYPTDADAVTAKEWLSDVDSFHG